MFLNKKTLDLVKFGKCTELNDEITKNSDIISFVDEEKNTLLHKAVRFRQPKVIACLLDAGAEVDSRDESGWTPLHWGCAYGCKEEVQLLVRFGAKITSKTNSGWTVLHWASAYGSTEIAAFLILKGANPAEQSTDGRSPIDIARSYGKIDMEKYLEEYLGVIKLPIHRAIWERASPTDVEARVESNRGGVQQKDQNGKLPIHYAIEMKSPTEVVEVVLRSYPEGATMKDKKGNLAFHRAIELEAPSPVIRALLSVHKDAAQYPHQDGKLPIFKAIEGRLDLDVISAIAQAYPAGTLIKDANGRLPIHVALQSQESEGHIALALLQTNGSMAAERDNAGVLPLVRALETRAPATLVFELLRSYPQAAHEKGKDGYLPLHRAVDLQYPSELIVTLLEANLSAAKEQGKDGYLPLHRAVDKQAHVAVVEALAAAYPEGMLVKTKDGSLPIHMALDKPTPFPIVNALLARNPAIAREKDRGGILPLSRVLERESDQNLVLAILRAYCAAAAETGRDGNLPLHRAIDLQLAPDVLLEILDASPEACSRRDKTGALSLHKALERMSPLSVTSRVLQAFPEAAWVRDKSIGGLLPIQWAMESAQSDAFVSLLLPYTLPVDRFTGNPVPDVECIWTQILQSTPPEKYLDAVEGTLEACADLVEQLANALDKHGRKALDIATPKSLNIMRQGAHIKLIDLDASASFHNDKKQYSGAKFSSAYVPPELVYQSPDITNNITPIPPVVKRAGFLQGEYLPALEAITQTIFSMISRLRLSDRIVHQSEAAWVSVASPGSRVPSVCGGEGQGGSGVKAALAALQTQVKDRDEEIDNLVKDVHQRDKIISDLIVSHEEEIRLLKAAFEVQGGSQLTESGGPVLESGSNTAVSDVASDLFAGNIPMPTRRMSATESIGSASALRQKLQDAKLLESVTPPGTGVMDHNHSPVSTSLAKALEGTMTTTPSFTTTTTTTTTTSPRNGLISPRNVVGGTVSCEDVGGKSSTDETQGTVDSSRSKRTSRHDTSTVIGAVNKHAEPKAAASTAAVPRDPSSSRRKTEQASKAGDSEKKKSNGSGSTNAGGNSHSSSTRSGKPHQQESKK
eukprot:gene2721-5360_t